MGLQIKIYELREKDTNELIICSIEENVVRAEWVNMKEAGEDMNNVVANQTFMPQDEWNAIMKSGLGKN